MTPNPLSGVAQELHEHVNVRSALVIGVFDAGIFSDMYTTPADAELIAGQLRMLADLLADEAKRANGRFARNGNVSYLVSREIDARPPI